MDISKLYIEIKVVGDINKTIQQYKYELNSDPTTKSKENSLYITKRYLLDKKELLKSKYKNDLKSIFLNKNQLEDVISKLPKSIIAKSNEMYESDKSKDMCDNYSDISANYTDMSSNYNIIDNNIQLILNIFFPKNSFFYINGNKFIINNKSILHKRKNIKCEKLPSYEMLKEKLSDKLQKEQSKRVFKKQEEYNKILKSIQDKEVKEQFKKKYKIVDLSDEEKKKKLLDEIQAKSKFDIMSLLSTVKGRQLINNYGLKRVKLMNNKLIKNKKEILYKYVENKGIKIIDEKLKNIYCIITLNLIHSETPLKSQFKMSCKSRKKIIYDLYNKIFTRKKKLSTHDSIGKTREDELSILDELSTKDELTEDKSKFKKKKIIKKKTKKFTKKKK
jgi:hypothetical protein